MLSLHNLIIGRFDKEIDEKRKVLSCMEPYSASSIDIRNAIDILKKYIKKGDKTPLILDTTIELPDGEYSIRGIPFTLGWLKEKLNERAWRVQVDPESGARTNENMLIALYQKTLSTMAPDDPMRPIISKRLTLATGIEMPKENPAAQVMAAAQSGQGKVNPEGPPVPIEEVQPEPAPPPSPEEAAGVPA